VHVAVPPTVTAQQARPEIFAIETSAAIDTTSDDSGQHPTNVITDAVISASLGRGFEAIVRPFVHRMTTGEWNRQIWIAAVRYERAGRVGIRVDGGLIPSPVGLANLTLRPSLNPAISQPASLFSRLPRLGGGLPAANLLGAVYPFGAQVAVSGRWWDARAAVIDASPLRPRRVFGDGQPPRFANFVAGGGVAPFAGIRFGASVTRGGWLEAGESAAVSANHAATVVTVESEVSFAHTKFTGEWTRDFIDTPSGRRTATGWFVQGQQTLTPRWFVAGRVDAMSSPLVQSLSVVRQRLFAGEEILGYRLTPELTFRVGHRMRRAFGVNAIDHQAAASVVWWKRWR
jgi:hypothetical protein